MESAFSPHAGRTPAEHAGIRNDAAGSRRRDVAASRGTLAVRNSIALPCWGSPP